MNMPRYVWEQHALYLTLLVFVAGCTWQPRQPLAPPQSPPPTPPTFSCASLTESYWSEFRFGSDSPDDVAATAAKLWGIDSDQVDFGLTIDGKVYHAFWGDADIFGAGAGYGAWFDEGQRLRKISVEWGLAKPKLSQTVECLGGPDSYTAFYEVHGEVPFLNLALFYPQSGIIVRHSAPSWSTELPHIRPIMLMKRFVVVPAGTAEQMATEMYHTGDEAPDRHHSVCLLKPWPSSIDALEIATDEEKNKCGFS
ncbi:MAG: hypothetical protein OXF62_21945 [Caldilineaceae bacterium]|nr:hypothetical protein [Caldilineaceae bacterium]